MSDTHGASGAATDGQRATPGGRGKVETERRAFAPAPAEAAQPTNLEAVRHTAPADAPHELTDIWRDAFAPLLSAQMEAHRWFEQFWRQTASALPSLATGQPLGGLGAVATFGAPAADLRETEAGYQLCVELPGLSREDIDLKLERDTIRVSGQKLEEKQEGRADYRVSERRFGRFERSFPIPTDVDREAIAAAYADGVLKITLPKAEAAQREVKQIEIR